MVSLINLIGTTAPFMCVFHSTAFPRETNSRVYSSDCVELRDMALFCMKIPRISTFMWVHIKQRF